MHFGVTMFPTDYAIRPDELARALEDRGFESLWVPKSLSVSIFGAKPDRTTVDQLEGAGVDRVVFMVASEARDKVLPLLDAYAALRR